jgi:probable F420-dependent oxidoreductase
LRLGIVTPVVTLNPRVTPPAWEAEGGIDDVVVVAKAADALGYGWLTCSEHVAIPTDAAKSRGGRYWDPAVVLSYVAACTSSIRLLTYVLVLAYHHPLEIVKRFGSLDEASGGRVILGVGVGTLEPEFDLLGATFEGRGSKADEAIRAIRAAFATREPAFEGEHFSFSDVVVDPCGLQRPVPVWVGGRTRRSLRRALVSGDGWIPFGLGVEKLGEILGEPELASVRSDRGRDFDLVFAPESLLDPLGDPDGARAVLRSYAAIGATGLSLRFRQSSRAHYVEQLEAMSAVAADEEL